MEKVYLGLGSNLGDRQKYLENAIEQLEAVDIRVLKKSSMLETEPLGGLDQPKYLNMVLFVETDLSPRELLKNCQQIENKFGRKRNKKWDSRTIDIDILLYAEQKIDESDLKIPHPAIKNRDFVLSGLEECGFQDWELIEELEDV